MRILITQEDIAQTEAVLEDFLASFHPDVDYTKGTPQNDIVVQGLKVPLMLLTSIATSFRQTRSLANIKELIASLDAADQSDVNVIAAKADIEAAVREILSNWYSDILGGKKSRGLVTLHLSSNTPFILSAGWRTYRTASIGFINTATSDSVIVETDMTPILDANGIVVEYQYRTMVEAMEDGDIGDVNPGTWEVFDLASPFLFKVSSDYRFANGRNAETPQEAIDRFSDGGVTERSLHNQRSISARFAEDFNTFLPVRVIRAGDVEMQRDLILLGGSLRLHQLNKLNVYCGGPIQESRMVTGTLGASWAHPRTAAVELGTLNRLMLPFEPILFIREVRFNNSHNDPTLSSFTDSDGYVRFELIGRYTTDASGNRVDNPYTNLNQAKLIPHDLESHMYWGSTQQTMFLEINPATFMVSNPPIEIVYDTIEGFSTVHTLFSSAEERPGTGSPLAYSYYPVVLSFNLEYVKRNDILPGLVVDVAAAKNSLVAFVRAHKQGNPLFSLSIVQEFMRKFGDIAAGVRPLTLSYYTWLPDGSKLEFSTTDRVSLNTAFLKPNTYSPLDENNNPLSLSALQYSERNMIVYTDEVNITITKV